MLSLLLLQAVDHSLRAIREGRTVFKAAPDTFRLRGTGRLQGGRGKEGGKEGGEGGSGGKGSFKGVR